MAYEDYSSADGGSSGSQGISGPPAVIQKALDPKRKLYRISAGKAIDAVPDNGSLVADSQAPGPASSPDNAAYTASPVSKGTPEDRGIFPAAEDISSGRTADEVGQITNEPFSTAHVPRDAQGNVLPTLAPQGPKNAFLRKLSQFAGLSGPTPSPGEMYEGPVT